MSMDNITEIFFVECDELLQDMEEKLLAWNSCADKEEAIGAIFRSAHTIKGSAGIFAFDGIVSFAHIVESVLDEVREERLEIDNDLLNLLLLCKDHIAALVLHAQDPEAVQNLVDLSNEPKLVQQLHSYLKPRSARPGTETMSGVPSADKDSHSAEVAVVIPAPVEAVVIEDREEAERIASDNWHISVRFGRDTFRNGMDPLSFLRYLGTIGEIAHIVTTYDDMPEPSLMDPESCYLSFAINFKSTANKQMIEDVFAFVVDDCHLHIIPPREKIQSFKDIIDGISDESKRLGEILVECGTLTKGELQRVLQLQQQSESPDMTPRKLGEIVVENSLASAEVVQAAIEKQISNKSEKSGSKGSIRIDAEKLDRLINLVGELVIAGSGVEAEARVLDAERLKESTITLKRLIENVRDSTLGLRMVQIADSFNRMNRVVRDLSNELCKEIELQISGGDTELDKTVVEKISDPLLHLVRNSIDHGIENVELRRLRGKPEIGTIWLNAFHDSGNIVIEVKDDGGGLNAELIRNKAVARGLIQEDQELSLDEIHRLIFEPGFSTAAAVSNISGRGVGMDVVRRNIEALRGTILIDSEEGLGTTISIRLPLTLAIIDGFMMSVNSSAYVLPLDMVEECIELKPEIYANAHTRGYINLRGEVLPLIRLREQFGHTKENESRENVVVVHHGGQRAGFVVDTLIGEFQTVIKPLGTVFRKLAGISGSTILGSGEVALILDAPALMMQAVSRDNAVANV